MRPAPISEVRLFATLIRHCGECPNMYAVPPESVCDPKGGPRIVVTSAVERCVIDRRCKLMKAKNAD